MSVVLFYQMSLFVTVRSFGKSTKLVSARHMSKFNTLKMTNGQVPVSTLSVLEDNALRNVYYIDKGEDTNNPPLVLIAGTAQTIDTFTPHINQISKTRRLIIPELRGQGRTELNAEHCTIEQQVKDITTILNKMNIDTIHLGGFSFGGRVAMAYAAHCPDRVKLLSITAIPFTRPIMGKIILDSWMDGLSRGNMRECAWSFIINGYSKEFLEKNYERLSLYVDMIVQANDPTKVFNLIHQSAKTFPGDPYAIPQCAEKIQCPTQVIAAKQDRIAGFEPVHQLAQHISQCEYIEMNTGHLAPFENPLVWRKHLMDFMNRD